MVSARMEPISASCSSSPTATDNFVWGGYARSGHVQAVAQGPLLLKKCIATGSGNATMDIGVQTLRLQSGSKVFQMWTEAPYRFTAVEIVREMNG